LDTRADVVIVSIFGRGAWLAKRLRKTGMQVSWIDLTSCLGSCSSEDWVGPFAFFKPSYALEDAADYFSDNSQYEDVSQGLSVWTASAPLELRGAVAQHQWTSRFGLAGDLDHLKKLNDHSVLEKGVWKNLVSRPIEDNWVFRFLLTADAISVREFKDMLEPMACLPLAASIQHRHSSKDFVNQVQENLRKEDVNVIVSNKLLDLSLHGRFLDGVEIQADRSGVVLGKNFVLCLSSWELDFILSKGVRSVYTSFIEPKWVWTRFRVRFDKGECHRDLPSYIWIVNDEAQDFTRENFMIVESSDRAEDYDVWVRLPCSQRVQRGYHERMAEMIVRNLESRIPASEVSVIEMPMESRKDLSELGPSLFVHYSEADISRDPRTQIRNLYLSQPEVWSQISWLGSLKKDKSILDNLTKWWRTEQQKRGEHLSDRALHPS